MDEGLIRQTGSRRGSLPNSEGKYYGRLTRTKSTVVIMAERQQGKTPGRIRLVRVPDARKESIKRVVLSHIAKGTTLYTDGCESYAWLDEIKDETGNFYYRYYPTNIKQSGLEAHKVLPRVHLVASIMKRWLLATHQGAVRPEYLDYYLDKFTFRFNRRKAASRGLLFYRLLEQAMQVEHTSNAELMGKFFIK